MRIAEDFLHFIWQFRLYSSTGLTTTDEQPIQVLHPGIPNTHAGPDFSQAKIRLSETIWVGQVEIHVKASEWMLHGHQHDEAYENVILHVVYENDKPVSRKTGTEVPVLVLKGLFDEGLYVNYNNLINSFHNFPCEKQIAGVEPMYIHNFLSRLAIERFEHKAIEVNRLLQLHKGDWNETFYICLARNFGFKVNALPFELLAGSLKQQILGKHKDQPGQIEALLFGQAGFLSGDFEDDYPLALKNEYSFLQKKYNLQPIAVSLWKFLRMRPQNFPTIRLAQLATLTLKSSHLFSLVLEITDPSTLVHLFSALPVHTYWKTHYHFHKETANVNLQLGKGSINNLIINTVCLFLFVYGKTISDQRYIDRAIYFLEQIPAEKNSIISLYEASGVKIDNAYLSQALLQLNKSYCTEKKCLNCTIGIKILKK
jgi:hypothetical protein